MQLTKIVLNPASRLARADLADAYEMHSTLSRAFATADGEPVSRFLWRQESTRPGEPGFVLVQSSAGGDWRALRTAKPGWAASIESREWQPANVLRVGQQLQFRLRANPTVTRDGKRRALLKQPEQESWLARQLQRVGLEAVAVEVREGVRLTGRRRKESANVIVNAVLFEGVVAVVDAVGAAGAIETGIGHAKMMGLGLLSVAPIER